jgi:hypothetical protein
MTGLAAAGSSFGGGLMTPVEWGLLKVATAIVALLDWLFYLRGR